MPKKEHNYVILLLILILVALVFLIFSNFYLWRSYSNGYTNITNLNNNLLNSISNQISNAINNHVISTTCQNYLMLSAGNPNFIDGNSYNFGDCGVNTIINNSWGQTEAFWSIQNPNNFTLNLPCNIVIKQYAPNGALLSQEIASTFEVNVHANWTNLIDQVFYLKKCYTRWELECQNISMLPQCNSNISS